MKWTVAPVTDMCQEPKQTSTALSDPMIRLSKVMSNSVFIDTGLMPKIGSFKQKYWIGIDLTKKLEIFGGHLLSEDDHSHCHIGI